MDGWMDGWMDGRLDGWTAGRLDGWTIQTNNQTDSQEWSDELID